MICAFCSGSFFRSPPSSAASITRAWDRKPRHPPASEREPLIVNVGHLAERKGQEILFRAFALLAAEFPQWKLALVGPDLDGTGLAIAREAGRLGLAGRVFLVGSVDDPNPWYRRAGIYVQPSHFEALGLALQEALSSGCPAVGTRVGGIPELIEAGRNGLLVAPGDAPALAAALRELIRSPEERARLGAGRRPEPGGTGVSP